LIGNLLRIHRATGHVVGVLQGDEAGLRAVVNLGGDAFFNFLPGEDSLRAKYRTRHAAGEMREHSHLIIKDVAALFADNLLTGAGVDLDGNLVPHSAARNEDGGLASENFCGTLLQAIDSWI